MPTEDELEQLLDMNLNDSKQRKDGEQKGEQDNHVSGFPGA